ncbi:MAG: hypothetical protein ABI193_18910 [Minicystis sp.]
MQNPSSRIAALISVALLGVSACTRLLGDFSVGTSGGGGAGGATTSTTGNGGATTSTTGNGGATTSTTGNGGSTTTATTGTGAMCLSEKQCAEMEKPCAKAVCTNGTCSVTLVEAGVPIATQFDGDCKLAVCDGNGKVKVKPDTLDIEDDKNPCTTDACMGQFPTHAPAPPGSPCILPDNASAKVCSVSAQCVQCVGAIDCGGAPCQDGKCVQASCMDGVKDSNETDTDCGGSCGGCSTGGICIDPGDCLSHHCAAGICAAASCNDAIQNQGETSKDCGGPFCPPCPGGSPCLISSDCDSGVCTDNLCAFDLCLDSIQDGSETDIDCGGGSCLGCTSGKSCMGDLDCESKVCKPGFTCE